jgi:hypothetical protein
MAAICERVTAYEANPSFARMLGIAITALR